MITKVNPVLPDQQKRGTYICFCFRVRFSRLPSATSVIGILTLLCRLLAYCP